MFDAIRVSLSAMDAQQAWLESVSNNLANARTVKTPDGGPYKRQSVVFEQALQEDGGQDGVRVAAVLQEDRPPEMRYEPGHPLADAQGMVAYPAIDLAQEMAEMTAASRAYEANAVALSNTKELIRRALDI